MALKLRLQQAVRQAQELLEMERMCREAAERAAPAPSRPAFRSASEEEVVLTLLPLGEPGI
jgi:hypothetical protein